MPNASVGAGGSAFVFCRHFYMTKSRKIFRADINCFYCTKTFTPVRNLQYFCSKFCWHKSYVSKKTKKQKTKECKICKKEFTPYTSLDKFCSVHCRIENIKSKRAYRLPDSFTENRKGKGNPSYKHGLRMEGAFRDQTGQRLFQRNAKEYKLNLIDLKGFLHCEKCNISNVKFECHHIVYRSEKPMHEFLHSKHNIILLCIKCHNWFHQKKGNRNELVESRKLNIYFGEDILNK